MKILLHFFLFLYVSAGLFSVEDNSRSDMNSGIIYAYYEEMAFISGLLEYDFLKNDSIKKEILNRINSCINSIRDSPQLISGLSDDSLDSLNRRYIGMNAYLISIRKKLTLFKWKIENLENESYLNKLTIENEIQFAK